MTVPKSRIHKFITKTSRNLFSPDFVENHFMKNSLSYCSVRWRAAKASGCSVSETS